MRGWGVHVGFHPCGAQPSLVPIIPGDPNVSRALHLGVVVCGGGGSCCLSTCVGEPDHNQYPISVLPQVPYWWKVASWGKGAELWPGVPPSWAGYEVPLHNFLWTPPSREGVGGGFYVGLGTHPLNRPCAFALNHGSDHRRLGTNMCSPPPCIQHLMLCACDLE